MLVNTRLPKLWALALYTTGVVATLLLQGCATAPIYYGTGGSSEVKINEVKTIAILPPPFSGEFYLGGEYHDCGGFYPICFLDLLFLPATETFRLSYQKRLNLLLASSGFSVSETFIQVIAKDLREKGYEIRLPDGGQAGTGSLTSYPSNATIDAILNVSIEEIGYYRSKTKTNTVGAVSSLKYVVRPTVSVLVTLVRASDSSALMQQTVRYNPKGPSIRGYARDIQATPDGFSGFRDLVMDLETGEGAALERLTESIRAVAEFITRQLPDLNRGGDKQSDLSP